MTVVFCTTAKGRTPHLARTLPQNLKNNPNAKFIVLGYNDGDGLADYISSRHAEDLSCGRLSFYQYREVVPFRMAHAKNLAHRLGILEGGGVLVNLDADNFTGKGFADYVVKKFTEQNKSFLWSRMVKDGEGRLPKGISGRIAVTGEAFLLAGGYDEKYETHSPDDKDFSARLRRLGYDGLEIESAFLSAILHNDKMRFREYPHVTGDYSKEYEIQHEHSVVNSGKVGCGVVYKNFSSEPITIAPIPTRIFGIGMHKTGTTSLHNAFQILGLKSGHWENAHWAKAIWREMNHTGKSPTLEMFYALSDLPITLLFRKLDAAYPGSKFILTVRDEWRWLASCAKHWGPGNKFRQQWDNDPFSHIVHEKLYGRTDFDPTTFIRRYRRHNSEVLEYFKDRPSDLLTMDMDGGCGWRELCGFLQAPIPSVAYPISNKIT